MHLLFFIYSPGLHVIHIAAEMAPVAKVHSCTLIPMFYPSEFILCCP